MLRTKQALQNNADDFFKTTCVLITHNHSDHISYYPLRVLQEYGLDVYVHQDNIEQLKNMHFNGDKFKNLKLKQFKNTKFQIGDMSVRPFEVTHNPNFPTYGFEIFYEDKKAVIVTDFCRWDDIFSHFVDADFIFVESNHDLKLLELYYNPNSRFHMPNPQTGNLLVNVSKESKKHPKMVCLGHISSQRNKPAIAINETKRIFHEAGMKMKFDLLAAPLREAAETVRIG
jgi:phosphoribosyl 1,2-cyclic phosphodiesterase